jgi:hypothetical protein
MQSKATTVRQYLSELPADRRAAISAVREVILKNLDKGYEEGMQYGMIGYYVPHRLYPPGYHCDPHQPLPFAGLASQKNHMALYLMSVYGEASEENWLRDQFARAGKKLDMGKCCVRFKKLDDLPLNVIGEAIRRVSVERQIEVYESSIRRMNKRAPSQAANSPDSAKARRTVRSASSARSSAARRSR